MRTSDVTDAELAERAAEGEEEAFGELVRRHASAARRMAQALLGDPHDADDATQDGFLAAWRAIDRYDPRRPFRPWLLRIVLNAARDLRRRHRVRRTEALSPLYAAPDVGPEQETDRALLRERFAAAVTALTERQRVTVTLFDAEGYSHAEIAAVLGVAEGTVRSDLHHARRALRSALAPFQEGSR